MLDTLLSWTAHADDGVKYFSGSATYQTTFTAGKKMVRPGDRIFLDLGAVGDMAEVSLNGKSLPLLWKPPFRTEITTLLKPGENQLEIIITNEWTNRLIGDLAHPDQPVLDSYTRPFGGAYQLTDSGLIGPVRLLRMEKEMP